MWQLTQREASLPGAWWWCSTTSTGTYGADLTKFCATGGVLSKGTVLGAPQGTVEELRAIVEEAHARGLKVASHAHGTIGGRSNRMDPWMGMMIGHESLNRELRRVRRDDDVADRPAVVGECGPAAAIAR